MTFSAYYDSTDSGLSGLTNVAGTLVTFLDAILVNGYNSKTLTSLTCSGSVVTATLTAHGFRDRQMVTISGATPAGYNGTWQITPGSTSANTFQFSIAPASGLANATGTLACIVAPLGWTAPFTGTNLRVYKPAAGNQLDFRIDDSGTTTARFLGYESMTDVNTGTNGFPTAAQVSGGTFWSKSSAVTARRTIAWGNASCLHVFTDYTGDGVSGTLTSIGDDTPFKSGDAWCTHVMGQSAAGTFEGSMAPTPGNSVNTFGALAGEYYARSYTQLAGSVTGGKVLDSRFTSGITGSATAQMGSTGANPFTYPSPVDGNLWTSQITTTETVAAGPRGTMQGIYAPLHNKPLTHLQIYQGAGALAGLEFMALNLGSTGQILAVVSNSF